MKCPVCGKEAIAMLEGADYTEQDGAVICSPPIDETHTPTHYIHVTREALP